MSVKKITKKLNIENLNIASHGIKPLISPSQLKRGSLILDKKIKQAIVDNRRQVEDILSGKDSRLVAIVGPCSIHDSKAALDYAGRLADLAKKTAENLLIVMRVYLEKPRTTIGWKGLIMEPEFKGADLEKGLKNSRSLLLKINKLGLPVATEFLDPIVPQYIADLISWGAIGARTAESQIHRQIASGLSMPIGFKNGTDGNIQIAVNAIISARAPHAFLGISESGKISVIHTTGNKWAHLILRGGREPNYDLDSVRKAIEMFDAANSKCAEKLCGTKILVDCSHGNSGKDPMKQIEVCRNVVDQVVNGNKRVAGFMLESNIEAGRQDISPQMKYGVSITDACIGWRETETLLSDISNKLKNNK